MLNMLKHKVNLTWATFPALIMMCSLTWPAEIYHMNINNEKNQLILDVLKLALSKSSKNFSYIENDNPNVNLFRNKSGLDNGELSVLWAGTSQWLEKELLPIRIPVLKGLLGHRIFIIRRQEQPKFSNIKRLIELTKLKAGQGTFWEDTRVLKSNNFNVITINKYQNLFPMLAGKRFDFFPRAIYEPWVELNDYPTLDLVVEEKLLLIYPFAMYFFVAKDNLNLAKQIESGFEKAINDGSFDRLFFNNSMIKNALQKANLQDRLVFRLTNSSMSGAPPITSKKYWLDIDGIKK